MEIIIDRRAERAFNHWSEHLRSWDQIGITLVLLFAAAAAKSFQLFLKIQSDILCRINVHQHSKHYFTLYDDTLFILCSNVLYLIFSTSLVQNWIGAIQPEEAVGIFRIVITWSNDLQPMSTSSNWIFLSETEKLRKKIIAYTTGYYSGYLRFRWNRNWSTFRFLNNFFIGSWHGQQNHMDSVFV